MKQNIRHTSKNSETTCPGKQVVSFIRKRPDLSEVIRSLRESGRGDVADTIAGLAGVVEQKNMDQPHKPKTNFVPQGNQQYYGKYRNAYLFVNSTTASMDDQSKMLHGFMQTLKKSNKQDVVELLASAELIPITLPKNVVVLAIRVPLHAYLDSRVPKYVAAHSFMKAYLRKPRSDTQHLAQQVQYSTETSKNIGHEPKLKSKIHRIKTT